MMTAELRLAGLVRVEEGRLSVRNRIYGRVFDLPWVRANIPVAEAARQRAAFFRGVRRVIAWSLAVLLGMGALVLVAMREARRADEQARRADEQGRLASEQGRLASEKGAAAKAKAAEVERQAEQLAREAEEKLAARKEIVDNLVSTQAKVVRLLEAVTPVLGTKSRSRENILAAAQELQKGTSSATAELPEVQLGQADLLRVYSRIYSRLGNRKAALEQAEQARAIVAGWVKAQPENSELVARLVECCNTLGDALLGERELISLERRSAADLAQAMEAYGTGLDLARRLYQAHPDSPAWRSLVITTQNSIGDTLLEMERALDARQAYQVTLALVEGLLRSQPQDDDLRESLADVHVRLADVDIERSGVEAETAIEHAIKHLITSIELRRKLAEEQPADPNRQNNLATSYNKMGRAYDELGSTRNAKSEYDKAFDIYQRALQIRQALSEADSANLGWQRNLAFSYNNVASISWKLGNSARAIDLYEKRYLLSARLHHADETNAYWRIDYGEALARYADILLNVSDQTKRNVARALELSEEAAELFQNQEPKMLNVYAQALRFNGQAARGREMAEKAMKLLPPPGQRTARQVELAEDIQSELHGKARPRPTPAPALTRIGKASKPR
jgi:tetratricopeptide (TPR) repeat protein